MASHYSFDTESGALRLGTYICKGDLSGKRFTCGLELENRVITYAPIGCRSLREVKAIISNPGENVYGKWFKQLISATAETDFVFHVWNLAWEWRPIMAWLASLPSKDCSYDKPVLTQNNIYQLTIHVLNRNLTFVDDNNHYHTTVKAATASVKADPKFAKIMRDAGVEGKESAFVEQIHEIWYAYGPFSEEWLTYIHYAKVDAFCQALCCEHLFDAGRFCSPRCFNGEIRRCITSEGTALSASGAGFREAKSLLIYGCHYRDIPAVMHDFIEERAERMGCDFDEACSLMMGKELDRRWELHFGTPGREERLLIENNLRGGLVYGFTGVHKGIFYHYDYKSSYPYEYAYCKLPIATGKRIKLKEDSTPLLTKNGKSVWVPAAMQKAKSMKQAT